MLLGCGIGVTVGWLGSSKEMLVAPCGVSVAKVGDVTGLGADAGSETDNGGIAGCAGADGVNGAATVGAASLRPSS